MLQAIQISVSFKSFCCITVQLCLDCFIFQNILAKDYVYVFIFSKIYFQNISHHCTLVKRKKTWGKESVFYFSILFNTWNLNFWRLNF